MWTYILIHTQAHGHTQSYKHTNKIANLQKIKTGNRFYFSQLKSWTQNLFLCVFFFLHYCLGTTNLVSLGMRAGSRPTSGWWKQRPLFVFWADCVLLACAVKNIWQMQREGGSCLLTYMQTGGINVGRAEWRGSAHSWGQRYTVETFHWVISPHPQRPTQVSTSAV